MSCSKITRTFHMLAIIILAGVFGWAGLQKLIDPEGFSLTVFRYHLLPYEMVNAVALWIPGVELICAFLLLIPRFRLIALRTILVLLMVFSVGIGINLLHGNSMACGCFSSSPLTNPIGWVALLKNVVLAFLTVFLMAGHAGSTDG